MTLVGLVAVSWWFLVLVETGEHWIPQAIGPFPSQEICRQAGEAMIPQESRFWTEGHRRREALYQDDFSRAPRNVWTSSHDHRFQFRRDSDDQLTFRARGADGKFFALPTYQERMSVFGVQLLRACEKFVEP